MDNLRLSLTYGAFCLEIEGSSEVTLELFREIRNSGLGEITKEVSYRAQRNDRDLLGADPVATSNGKATTENNLPNTNSDATWPPFHTVVLQARPSSQREWILIGLAYATELGRKRANSEEIKSFLKETKRLDDSMRGNYATYMSRLAQSGMIEALADGEYVITQTGLDEAFKIVSREGQPAPKRKKATKAKAANYQTLDLGLGEKEMDNFRALWRFISPESTVDKSLVIAGWLKKEKGINAFSANHLYTMLRIAGESVSFNLLAALKNAKNRHSYFDAGDEPNTFSLNYIGEDRFNELQKDLPLNPDMG